MKLSTRGRYAVMAMADLAKAGQARPVTLAEIAGRQAIPAAYLEQLFGKLGRAGLVVGARGPGGGYRLARAPAETHIADIVLAVDEPIKATRCTDGSAEGCLMAGERCLTHDLWEELGRQIHGFLAEVTLADVIEKRVRGRAGTRAEARAPAIAR
ncbi:MAG: Rrf2 family transcriptional regulator [Alphaproteobacteria bacterium]|nr:Rrf2 family transcriptional regulator [Alphaproteobacteria bacterium]